MEIALIRLRGRSVESVLRRSVAGYRRHEPVDVQAAPHLIGRLLQLRHGGRIGLELALQLGNELSRNPGACERSCEQAAKFLAVQVRHGSVAMRCAREFLENGGQLAGQSRGSFDGRRRQFSLFGAEIEKILRHEASREADRHNDRPYGPLGLHQRFRPPARARPKPIRRPRGRTIPPLPSRLGMAPPACRTETAGGVLPARQPDRKTADLRPRPARRPRCGRGSQGRCRGTGQSQPQSPGDGAALGAKRAAGADFDPPSAARARDFPRVSPRGTRLTGPSARPCPGPGWPPPASRPVWLRSPSGSRPRRPRRADWPSRSAVRPCR